VLSRGYIRKVPELVQQEWIGEECGQLVLNDNGTLPSNNNMNVDIIVDPVYPPPFGPLHIQPNKFTLINPIVSSMAYHQVQKCPAQVRRPCHVPLILYSRPATIELKA